MDFQFSDKVRSLQERVSNFMDDNIYPLEAEYPEHVQKAGWTTPPIMDKLKDKARGEGLWNLFLSGAQARARSGRGLMRRLGPSRSGHASMAPVFPEEPRSFAHTPACESTPGQGWPAAGPDGVGRRSLGAGAARPER